MDAGLDGMEAEKLKRGRTSPQVSLAGAGSRFHLEFLQSAVALRKL